MKEGWHGDDYWILCEDQQESLRLTALYGVTAYLPDHFIIGLKSWDDFILCDRAGHYFTIPTVPVDPERLSPFSFSAETLRLQTDGAHEGKMRWFVKPICFGGDSLAPDNVRWLSLDEHVQIVKWWNQLYYDQFKTKK